MTKVTIQYESWLTYTPKIRVEFEGEPELVNTLLEAIRQWAKKQDAKHELREAS